MQKKYKKGLAMYKKLGGQIGKGIGKDEQGIVAPILSVKVNDGGGLGFSTIKKNNRDQKEN